MWHTSLVSLQPHNGCEHLGTKEEKNANGWNFQSSTANHPYSISARCFHTTFGGLFAWRRRLVSSQTSGLISKVNKGQLQHSQKALQHRAAVCSHARAEDERQCQCLSVNAFNRPLPLPPGRWTFLNRINISLAAYSQHSGGKSQRKRSYNIQVGRNDPHFLPSRFVCRVKSSSTLYSKWSRVIFFWAIKYCRGKAQAVESTYPCAGEGR